MNLNKVVRLVALQFSVLAPLFIGTLVFADSSGVDQVQTFMKSIIEALSGLAGMTATVFFVIGGFSYITSSGNPMHLERAKRTILYSAVGLAITVAAFVISNIVTSLATNAFGS